MEKGYSAARESDFRFWLWNYPADFRDAITKAEKCWNLDGQGRLCDSGVKEKG